MLAWSVLIFFAVACTGDRAPRTGTSTDPGSGASAFTLRYTCEMHGTQITTRETLIAHDPARVELTEQKGPARTATLAPADLEPLGRLIGGAAFQSLAKETPKEGVPHPGMKICTLAIDAAGKRTTMRWMDGDSFSPSGQATLDQITAEVGKLAGKVLP